MQAGIRPTLQFLRNNELCCKLTGKNGFRRYQPDILTPETSNMMKNILKISLISLVAITLSGCIKETFPKGSTVTEDQLTQSEGSIEYMLSGIPSAMTKAGTGGFYATYGWQFDFGLSSIQLATEFMLEDITALYELGYLWYSGFYQNQGMGSDYALCSFFWSQYYEWIKLANDVIAVGGEIDENTPENIKGHRRTGAHIQSDVLS